MRSERRGADGLRSCLLVIACTSLAAAAAGQTLRIYHIDVEQGSSTLIVAPGGHTLLVDSGKNGHGSRIKAVMDQAGVTQIDKFVATHYHEDHFGGIDDLVDLHVPVLEAYDRGDKEFVPASKKNEATWKGYLRTVGEDAIHIRRGDTIALDPLMTVTCIGSGGVVIGEVNPTPGQEENDMSVSLLITFGGFRYFIGGDTEAPTEAKMAAGHLVTNVDVYVADHHGSHSSSSLPFMTDLHPTVVVISNGDRADYQHPRQVTLDRFAAMPEPPTVFQANKYRKGGAGGNVPDAFIADPQTDDDHGTILLTVNGATNAYIVTYGTSAHTFHVKAAAPPATPPGPAVVIESLLPNPVGEDAQLEEVALKNKGSAAASLVGWILRDRSGLSWALSGSLAPGQVRTFRRNGKDMSLNNSGDEIVLLDATQAERDRFVYATSTEGVVIATGH